MADCNMYDYMQPNLCNSTSCDVFPNKMAFELH